MNLNIEFEKIKKDDRSFLGIDGGKIDSKTWFCGIEFGGELEGMSEYCKLTVLTYPNTKFDLPIPYRTKAGGFEKSTYDRYLAAMYINLFKEDKLINANNTRPIVDVLKGELYNKDSEIFKLNLYPLGKKDTSWDKNITNEFEIEKEDYYGNFFEKRKSFLNELVDKFKPKRIICTSINEYKEEFVEAFINNRDKIDYSWEFITMPNNRKFKISTYYNQRTSLIIIPFLGRGNLASYDDVIFMANYLRENYFN